MSIDKKLLHEYRQYIKNRKVTSIHQLPLNYEQKVIQIALLPEVKEIYLTGSFAKGTWYLENDMGRWYREKLFYGKLKPKSDLDLIVLPTPKDISIPEVDFLLNNYPAVLLYKNGKFF